MAQKNHEFGLYAPNGSFEPTLAEGRGRSTLVPGINQHHRVVLSLLGDCYAELYGNSV